MPKQDASYKSQRRASPEAPPQGITLEKILVGTALNFLKLCVWSFRVLNVVMSKSGRGLRRFPLLLRATFTIMAVIGIFVLVVLLDETNKNLVYGSFIPIYLAMVVSFLSSYFYTAQIRKRFILVKLRRAYRIGLIRSSLNPRRKRGVSNDA